MLKNIKNSTFSAIKCLKIFPIEKKNYNFAAVYIQFNKKK